MQKLITTAFQGYRTAASALPRVCFQYAWIGNFQPGELTNLPPY
jgi:hypothetical protein